MSEEERLYLLVASVGTWLIGLGFGVILGVRLPRPIAAWRNGSGGVVFGAFLVGIVLILVATYARKGHH